VRVEVPAGMTYAVSATAIQTTAERQRSVGEMRVSLAKNWLVNLGVSP
jgi:hypothetical protein